MQQDSLKKGVNLGGWISQFGEIDHRHFESFIQREDIFRIRDWGFDHVRLPVIISSWKMRATLGTGMTVDSITSTTAWIGVKLRD